MPITPKGIKNAVKSTGDFLKKNSYVSDIVSGLTGAAAGAVGGTAAGIVAGGVASGALGKFADSGGKGVMRKVDKFSKTKPGKQFFHNASMASKVIHGNVSGAWDEYKHPRDPLGKFESFGSNSEIDSFVQFILNSTPKTGKAKNIVDFIEKIGNSAGHAVRSNESLGELFDEFIRLRNLGKTPVDLNDLIATVDMDIDRHSFGIGLQQKADLDGVTPAITGASSSLRGGKLESKKRSRREEAVFFKHGAILLSSKAIQEANHLPVDYEVVASGVVKFLSESDSEKAKKFFEDKGFSLGNYEENYKMGYRNGYYDWKNGIDLSISKNMDNLPGYSDGYVDGRIAAKNGETLEEGIADVVRGIGTSIGNFITSHPGATAAIAGGAAAIAGGVAAASRKIPTAISNFGKVATDSTYIASSIQVMQIFIRIVEALVDLRGAIQSHPTLEATLSPHIDRTEDYLQGAKNKIDSDKRFGSSGTHGWPSVEDMRRIRGSK